MPGTVQINRVQSELGRASIKVGTAVASDDGRIVAYPFATASVFHEFAGSVNASVTSSGTGIDLFGNPMPWTATGGLTTSRIGTYAQFGLGSAFQLANTGWLELRSCGLPDRRLHSGHQRQCRVALPAQSRDGQLERRRQP